MKRGKAAVLWGRCCTLPTVAGHCCWLWGFNKVFCAMAACEDLVQAKMEHRTGENAECTSTKQGTKVHFKVQYAASRLAFQKQDIARLHPQNDVNLTEKINISGIFDKLIR